MVCERGRGGVVVRGVGFWLSSSWTAQMGTWGTRQECRPVMCLITVRRWLYRSMAAGYWQGWRSISRPRRSSRLVSRFSFLRELLNSRLMTTHTYMKKNRPSKAPRPSPSSLCVLLQRRHARQLHFCLTALLFVLASGSFVAVVGVQS
jgi:hypothetical protein